MSSLIYVRFNTYLASLNQCGIAIPCSVVGGSEAVMIIILVLIVSHSVNALPYIN